MSKCLLPVQTVHANYDMGGHVNHDTHLNSKIQKMKSRKRKTIFSVKYSVFSISITGREGITELWK